MSAREEILERIRRATDQAPDSARPVRYTRPELGDNIIDTCIERMQAVQMSVTPIQERSALVSAVRHYLQEHDLEGPCIVAPSLSDLPWPETYERGASDGTHAIGISDCFAAVAETGSLALRSDATHPATLAFLPDTHIVLLRRSQIVAHLEECWSRWQEMPDSRALNLITGPSRTADIELTLVIGAHGPRRVHVVLQEG